MVLFSRAGKNVYDMLKNKLSYTKYKKTTTISATVCSPCCRLTNDTEVSAAEPSDYTAASLLSPQHSTTNQLYFYYLTIYSSN